MNYQRKKFTCGPAAASNALEALGYRFTEDQLAPLMGTTPEGTTITGLTKGLTTLREACELQGPQRLQEKDPSIALLRLLEALRNGRPVIVAVKVDEPWDHWATAVGLLGLSGEALRIITVDSADENLMLMSSPAEFLARWCGPEGVRQPYFGVIV